MFTSLYRGVTRHKLTGRFEAHFWWVGLWRAASAGCGLLPAARFEARSR